MKKPHAPGRLIDTVRSLVSPEAAEALEMFDLRRDPTWTVDRESLRQILEERRLPAAEPVLDLEEVAGGVEIQEARVPCTFLLSLAGSPGMMFLIR